MDTIPSDTRFMEIPLPRYCPARYVRQHIGYSESTGRRFTYVEARTYTDSLATEAHGEYEDIITEEYFGA